MSAKVFGAVFERYRNGGGELLLALALADHAHDDGTHIFPYVVTLAVKTRQSVRAVQYQLKSMREAGWLIAVNSGNGGRSQASEYRISPEWLAGGEVIPPAKNDEKGADEKFAPFSDGAEKGANGDIKGATDGAKGANGNAKGCSGLHPHITVKNQKNNRQEPSPARKRSSGFDPMCLELPDWLDAELWGRWVRHRVQIRKPLTEEAAKQQIEDLAGYRQQGHTPDAVIKNAIGKSWQGLFAPSGAATGGTPRPGKFNPTDYVNRNRNQGGHDYDDGRTIDG
ncbi:helix-turn-helix domain-containing protein [Achromobacter marplatensis]|uniref:helix-turn-helix domain-containing protein n=1 Tax=Achromobacter marplatensis TaxID=470868 RepID=UPI0028EF1CAC|nr:helix-turn-helix domain-containing protein [Achromobacter marplatensis]